MRAKIILEKAYGKYKKEGLTSVLHAVIRKACINMPYVKEIWHNHLKNYLKKNYGHVIQKYKNFVPASHNSSGLNGIIWCMWWQGEENCPDIVKLCLASLRKNCPSHKLILITKDNFQQYADIPEHILRKVNDGKITLTHFSDIIRAELLKQHGGLWIDSTIFAACEIPEDIFDAEYFTIKRMAEKNPKSNSVSYSRWTGFFWGAAQSDSLLPSFVSEIFSEYWKNNDSLFDYFFLDYAIAVALDEFPALRESWEHLPVNNTGVFRLTALMNHEWDKREYAELVKSNTFFKLTYKEKFEMRTASGSETFYGHLLSEYGII